MENYYQRLQVKPTASLVEVEARLDDQYSKWRELVTHHDPDVVSEANQALQVLEEMRTVLLDPARRAAYNASITTRQENIGGLADPDTVLLINRSPSGGAPIRMRDTAQADAPQPGQERTDAWVCSDPKCKRANTIGTQFCVKCGKRLSLECPKCGAMAELANQYCSFCGIDKHQQFRLLQEQAIEELEQQLANQVSMVEYAETNPMKFANENKELVGARGRLGCVIPAVSFGYLWFVGQLFLIIGGLVALEFPDYEILVFIMAFLFVAAGLAGLITLIVFSSLASKKKKVRYFLRTQAGPELESLRTRLKQTKSSKYGDENVLFV